MIESLKSWLSNKNNVPEEKMYWYNAFWSQVNFVRDQVARLLASDLDQYQNMVRVVGTHTSKSIKCPVYFIELDEFHVTMRYNYFNWNISIGSKKPITCDFLDCFSDNDYDYCYAEGMADYKYGKYADDNSRFTICIDNHYDAYVFFRVLKQFFGIKYQRD